MSKIHINGLGNNTLCGKPEKTHPTNMYTSATCKTCIKAQKSLNKPQNHTKWLKLIEDGAKHIRKRNKILYHSKHKIWIPKEILK